MTSEIANITTPGLGWVVLYVDDVAASVPFWEHAFGLSVRFQHESGAYAELETGPTALALCARSLASESTSLDLEPRPTIAGNITLVVPDVMAAYQRALAAGATAVHEPVVKPWGQGSSYVRDPEGHLVKLATPVTG